MNYDDVFFIKCIFIAIVWLMGFKVWEFLRRMRKRKFTLGRKTEQ